MTSKLSDNAMRVQAFSTPQVIRERLKELDRSMRLLLSTPEIFALRRILLTGSGDSYIAGMAASFAFEQLAGIPAMAHPAMTVSRYGELSFPWEARNSQLLIAVSSSGEVARIVEAVQRYATSGVPTLAVTRNPESRVAQSAAKVLQVQTPPLPSAPRVASHILTMIALYLLAIRFGEVRGRLTQADASNLRKSLLRAADTMERMIQQVDGSMEALAKGWSAFSYYEILGSGPHMSAASFGAAKLVEAVGVKATAVETEEFAHVQYFGDQPEQIATFVLAPPGRSLGRAREIIEQLGLLGRPYRVLASADSVEGIDPDVLVPIESSEIEEVFVPLLYSTAVSLYAAHLADAKGARFFRGNEGVWSSSAGGKVIRESEMVIY